MQQAETHDRLSAGGKPTLYVVATPIGNLADVSARALATLTTVTAVAAEDTRITRRLLDHHGIMAKLIAVHEHNEARATQDVLAVLAGGGSVALVSDAGTPAVSDPGARVVAGVRGAGYAVSPIPGPSAVAAAVSVSGFASPQFLFYGFLPARGAARRTVLEGLAREPHTLVFYEAPHRVADSVAALAAVLGSGRRILLARELTKLFEETHVCALGEAPAWLAADAYREKGEFVLVVEGSGDSTDSAEAALDATRTLAVLLEALPLKQAVALAAKITGGNRNALYAQALELKQAADAD